MPKNELTAPSCAAPVDRLSLWVTSSRPIDQGSGITPSWDVAAINAGFCFADGAPPSFQTGTMGYRICWGFAHEAAPSFNTSIGFPLYLDADEA